MSTSAKVTLAPLDPNPAVDFLAVGCDEDALADSPLLTSLDTALGGGLKRLAGEERWRGKAGQTLSISPLGRLHARRVVLVGLGPRAGVTPTTLRVFAGRAARLASAAGAQALALAVAATGSSEAPGAIQALAEGALLGRYRFDKYLSEEKRPPRAPESLALLVPGDRSAGAQALEGAQVVATAVARARDLVNEPAGYLTPSRLAETAAAWVAEGGSSLTLEVLGPDECRRQNMGLFLAVAQGSVQEPRFLHVAYRPAGARKRVVLIGKGVTFDSGGLSLKTNDGMLDMKTDMAGAAAVLATLPAVAALGLPIEVHGLVAATENMPSGSSYKLGDVLRSKAGKTVEINNTDAEGRLTLADAITYGLELKPDLILDFATLTGACVVALGPHIAGVMSNDETVAADWLAAAKDAGEEMWRLPLPDRLLEQLKSDVADMRNTGERWGGALTAGLFLREFVGKTPWAHVDIAGPASADKELGHVGKGGTGFAVATMVEYLRRVASGASA